MRTLVFLVTLLLLWLVKDHALLLVGLFIQFSTILIILVGGDEGEDDNIEEDLK
jgi:hypothetical protein